MQIVYAKEPPPEAWEYSIFLAGPTPRGDKSKSWRPEMMEALKKNGFKGVVFNPEPREKFKGDYLDQVEWEQEMRLRADIILFWVPREMPDMPAFTTNIEFGEDYRTGRVIYGRPDGAFKTRYLDALYRQITKTDREAYNAEPHSDMNNLAEEVMRWIQSWSVTAYGHVTPRRYKAELAIPLLLWTSTNFKIWYDEFLENKDELKTVRVETRFYDATLFAESIDRESNEIRRIKRTFYTDFDCPSDYTKFPTTFK